MPTQVLNAFFQTALHMYSARGKDEGQRNVIKQKWAQTALEIFGFKLEVRGTPPVDATSILVGNHVSYLDIPVVMASTPNATFISKDDIRKWPLIGAGAAAAGTVFVNRKSGADRSAVRDQIFDYLKRDMGTKIVVFPSGTTTLDESLPWKRGIFEIAKKSGVPIQLFNICYQPLRESAYIDDDNLLVQMAGLSKFRDKTVTLTWLDRYEAFDEDPSIFAESLRSRVRAFQEPDLGLLKA